MKKSLLLLLLICFAFSLNAQVSTYIDGISTAVGIVQKDNTLYIGSVGTQTIFKVDLTDPNLTLEPYVTGINFPTKFVVIGDDLYFTASLSSVRKIDLTQPVPTVEFVASVPSAYGLAFKDNYLYVSERNFTTSALHRFDYTQTNPTVETVLGGIAGTVNNIAIKEDELYFAFTNTVSKIDLTDITPSIDVVVEDENNVLEVAIKDDILYYSDNYLKSIDLTNPTAEPETLLSGLTSIWGIDFLNDDFLLVQQTAQRILKLTTGFIDPTMSPDYSALESIYNNTNGTNWNHNDNWLDLSKPLYSWHGLEVDENNRVTSINLFNNALSGPFPIAVGSLANLESLGLDQNELTGTLGSEIGGLSNLNSLSISNNELEGQLPANLSNLTNISFISVAGNNFSGSIPFNSPNAGINISNNLFDFSDIEPFFITNNFNYLIYSPQKTADDEETIESPTGTDIELTVDDTNINRESEGTSMNNEFQWFKDDIAISGANANTYSITDAQESDSGVYHCEITNAILPDLTIVRADITVTIDDNLNLQEYESDSFVMYPNPAKNWLTIKTQSINNAEIKLYDAIGKLVLQKPLENDITILAIDHLPNGIYLVSINSETVKETKRFVKQ
ncbi:T9SS type A sorting domain-containing protein [Psychroserpens sp. XS_ASV72]|uniref:T9SS type A sorting domain-containing protein n=1 Tax=Psychroserpens sp. XS_ASV72 TaxID=3241293 RepID=UPI003514F52C